MSTDTDVVVIGGGGTGCGVARDLAMRGVDVTLLEQGWLNAGTTGRSHGLLHSGARYADVDPESAVACAEENRVLRRIAGASVEPTGGFVVQLGEDDDDYFERKLAACRHCGIDATVVHGARARERVPKLTDEAVRAIAVPDAVVYPSRLVAATAASAREHGASIRTGTTVIGIELGDPVRVRIENDREGDSTLSVHHVVNAAGAWAGRVAGLAGLDVTMAPTRGLMVALEHTGLRSVLNRCRPPGDGDIVVPHPVSAVCGTTSVPVDDLDDQVDDPRAVQRIRREAAAMLPPLADAGVRRSFSGVRPLYDAGGRNANRDFRVLDHETRDGRSGMTTVVGGKLTTHRLMAEAVADHVTDRLGLDASGRTAEEPLHDHDDPERLDALARAFGAVGPADVDVVGVR